MMGVGIQWACYEKPRYHTNAFEQAVLEVDEAAKLGVDTIRIDLEVDTFTQFELQYDAFFSHLRSKGFKLFLWALPAPGSTVPLADYDAFLAYLAFKYQPEYLDTYGEAPNPQGTLTWRIAETPSMTVDDWVQASFSLVQNLRQYAPYTKIGMHSNAGKAPGNPGFDIETQFFSRIANVNGPFDWIGIEPYSVLEVDQQEAALNQYWDRQIPLWFAETDYLVVNQPDDDNERIRILEKSWDAAKRLNAEGYILFALYDSGLFHNQTDYQHWGIIDRNWQLKPSYQTFKLIVQEAQPTTTDLLTLGLIMGIPIGMITWSIVTPLFFR